MITNCQLSCIITVCIVRLRGREGGWRGEGEGWCKRMRKCLKRLSMPHYSYRMPYIYHCIAIPSIHTDQLCRKYLIWITGVHGCADCAYKYVKWLKNTSSIPSQSSYPCTTWIYQYNMRNNCMRGPNRVRYGILKSLNWINGWNFNVQSVDGTKFDSERPNCRIHLDFIGKQKRPRSMCNEINFFSEKKKNTVPIKNDIICG